MRVALVTMLLSATAAANPRDPAVLRPDLKTLRATTWVAKDGKLVENGTDVRTYDAAGRVVRHEGKDRNGKPRTTTVTKYDAGGRTESYTYSEPSGRKEVRRFTYKLDPNGRITEKTMRDPAKPAGELIRYEYRWEPDGSHVEQAYRHYAKEGPYKSHYEKFDAKGRSVVDCAEHGGCSMIEYNAQGDIARIRQQRPRDPDDKFHEDHYYLVYENTYDKAGRLVTQILGGTQTDYTWNARGEIVEIVGRRIPAQGGRIESKTVYTYEYR